MPKIFWLIFFLALAFLLGFFFLSYNLVSENLLEQQKSFPQSLENFTIKETKEGIIVLNSDLGLELGPLEGWRVEKDFSTNTLFFFFKPNNGNLLEDKSYTITLKGQKTQTPILEEIIHFLKTNSQKNGDFVAKIGQKEALKEEIILSGLWQVQVSLPLPENNIIFIATSCPQAKKEDCSKIFNQFLEKIKFSDKI